MSVKTQTSLSSAALTLLGSLYGSPRDQTPQSNGLWRVSATAACFVSVSESSGLLSLLEDDLGDEKTPSEVLGLNSGFEDPDAIF